MDRWRSTSIPAALVLLGCLLAAGCSNATVDTVTSLSTKFTGSLTTFKGIPNDLYGTCIRVAAWDYYKVAQLAPTPIAPEIKPGPAAPDASEVSPSTFVPPPPVVAGGTLGKLCTNIQGGGKEWATANTIVIDYISALNDLAGGGKAQTYGFKGLATSMKDAWFVHLPSKDTISSDQVVNAGSGLDQALAAAFATERAAAVRTFATQANDPIRTILTLLYAAAQDYSRFLSVELAEIDAVYANTVVQTKQNLPGVDATNWAAMTEQIANNDTALHDYVGVLNTISCAQGQLTAATVAAEAVKKCVTTP